MRGLRSVLLTGLLPFFVASCFAQDAQELTLEKSKPPLHRFSPQEPKRIQLSNGMVIFLQEDHELPLINGTARIRGGGREAPAAKVGMMAIYGSTWRTGGTTSKTGDQLDDFLEIRAAKVETGGGVDSTNISMSALKQDFDQVFDAFVDVLRNPEFRQDKVDLAKRQIKTSISRRNDEIGDIVSREAAKIGYGADSPYAREAQYWTVDAVTRQDLIDWHKRTVHPNNIIMGIVGDFDSAAVEAKLRKAFESWQKGPAVEPLKVDFKEPTAGVYFAEKEDVNQSEIQLISLGIRRDNPDYYAVRVMNEMFGGAFASRLFNSIRSKQGLAYSVGGGISSSFDHPGLFRLAMGTKSGTTIKAIHSLQAEIEKLVKEPGAPEEINRAKQDILNSFIFEFDSKDKILAERMAYEFYGYPADYLERFRAGIDKVTPADVAHIVNKYVAGRKFAVLVVGKSAEFDQPLSTLGQVHTLDISIPEQPPGAKGAEAAKPEGSNPEGRALMEKVVQAMGGKDKVQSVKSLASTSSQVRTSPQGSMTVEAESVAVYPNQFKTTLHSQQGDVSMVFTSKEAFLSAPGQGFQDFPPAMKETTIKDARRDPIYVAQHADDPAFSFRAAGTDKAGDKMGNVLEVTSEGSTMRWLVDDQAHVIRAQFKTNTMQGPVEREVDYEDYRPVDGVSIAFKRTTRDNGEVTATTEVKTVKLNPPINAAEFSKPSS